MKTILSQKWNHSENIVLQLAFFFHLVLHKQHPVSLHQEMNFLDSGVSGPLTGIIKSSLIYEFTVCSPVLYIKCEKTPSAFAT